MNNAWDLMERMAIDEKMERLLTTEPEDNFTFAKVRARTAKRDAHIDELLKRYGEEGTAYILEGIAKPCTIKARVAKLQREREISDVDIISGEAFSEGG